MVFCTYGKAKVDTMQTIDTLGIFFCRVSTRLYAYIPRFVFSVVCTILTVDVEIPSLLDLAGGQNGIFGSASQGLPHVGDFRLKSQRRVSDVPRLAWLQ